MHLDNYEHQIEHLNADCFISKANTNRLDILKKYIFSNVTYLFSENISENFLVIATFGGRDTFLIFKFFFI